MSLMITLAYVYWLYQREDETEAVSERKGLLNKDILILFIAGLMSVMVIHQYNFKVYKMLDSTINALSIVSSGNLAGGYQSFRNTMEKYDTPLNRDSRFMFVRSFMSGLASNEKALNHLPTQEKEEALEFMLDMAHQNIELAPHDTIANLQMAQAYNLVAIMYQDIKPELSSVYLSRSFEYINIALDLSPERLTTFFTKSQMLLNVGKTQEAIDLLEYGLTLNDEYHDTHCNLAPIYITIGNE
jgi:tetratricopeptide (TPR) repeat protein